MKREGRFFCDAAKELGEKGLIVTTSNKLNQLVIMAESEYIRKMETAISELFMIEGKDDTSKINKKLKIRGKQIFGEDYEKLKFINNQAKIPILFSFPKKTPQRWHSNEACYFPKRRTHGENRNLAAGKIKNVLKTWEICIEEHSRFCELFGMLQ